MARARNAKPSGTSKKANEVKPEAEATHNGEATRQKQGLMPAWQPGQSGNPAGRPKGSRNKLAEAFMHDMYEAWQASGKSVIADVIEKDPATFLRSVVQVMPKELDVNVNKYEAMTDDQLRAQFLAALREAQSLGIDLGAGSTASLH